MNIMSESLLRTVNVNVILPADKIQMPDKKGEPFVRKETFKTLYLLHGIFGSQVDWINGTNIQRWAEEKNLAVVMPAGENRFYVDQPDTNDFYGKFIGEELVDLTRRMFPLSRKKEDTFICGLSMGGYGALRNGLKYCDTFGSIAALSAASLVDNAKTKLDFLPEKYMERVFGDLKKAKRSDLSLKHLIRTNTKNGCTDQRIYLACGEADGLLKDTLAFNKLFENNGYDVTLETGPGAHEWDFWNTYIKHVVDWLPLDEDSQGLSSGNVGV